MKKIGFTLTEILVMVGVIGIIAVVTIVSLSGKRPDKDAIMLKKAYKSMSEVVATVVNNEDLYPLVMNETAGVFAGLKPSKIYVAALLGDDLPGRPDLQQTTNTWDDALFDQSSSCLSVPSSSGTSSGTSSGLSSGLKPIKVGCNLYMTIDGNIVVPPSVIENCKNKGGTWNSSDCECNTPNIPDLGSSSGITPVVPPSSGGKGRDIGSEFTSSTSSGSGPKVNAGAVAAGSASDGSSEINKISRYEVLTNTAIPKNAVNPKYTSANKFAYNFAVDFVDSPTVNGNVVSYRTKDGIRWTVTDNFTSATPNAFIDVVVNSTTNTSYRFTVDASGRITPSEDAAVLLQK